ncbi:hypothetical protein MK163_13830, partial [bacterium]|nr:hypothetical protein [bacterium]
LIATPPAAPDPALEAEEPPAEKQPPRPATQPRREEERDRSTIESDLLKKISQLQGDKKTKN